MNHDIIEEHSKRMKNLKKYYPYFKLAELSLGQYKDGKYADLDMGYITLAVLRFFIEENSFKDKDVIYEEYEEFISIILQRDFEFILDAEEKKELAGYLFDKLMNEGKPFSFDYFDPMDKKRKTIRMKLLDNKIIENTVYYFITADAIEFYLETKEIKEESSISIEQLLLEKLIDSQNFRGGTEVVKRINQEVSRILKKKNEVLSRLSMNVFEGKRAYEDYVKNVIRWFDDEQKLFKKNSGLIERALERAEFDVSNGEVTSKYYKAVDDIYLLEVELKKAMYKHSQLLQASTDLQKKADEIISKAKLSAIRNSFDFKNAINTMMEKNRSDMLRFMTVPFFNLNRKKTFDLKSIDTLLNYRTDRNEEGEPVKAGEEQIYVYADEAEEKRIYCNYEEILKLLLDMLIKYEQFTLKEFHEALLQKYTNSIFRNGDYYSFLVHMSQKKEYKIKEVLKKPDTFFEEMICGCIGILSPNPYQELCFRLEMTGEEENIKLFEVFEISNILFEKI